jgi:hypothetical protein
MTTITKPARSVDWTKDRIAALATPDVKQLRANAVRLNDPEITQRCDAVLEERPRGRGAAKKAVPGAAPKPRRKRKAPAAKAPEATSPETGGAA